MRYPDSAIIVQVSPRTANKGDPHDIIVSDIDWKNNVPTVVSTAAKADRVGDGSINVAPFIPVVISGGQYNSAFVNEFKFATPAREWIVNHNLNRKVIIEVYDDGGQEIMAEVVDISLNQCGVYFIADTTGFVRVF